jgi:hypothetical protein
MPNGKVADFPDRYLLKYYVKCIGFMGFSPRPFIRAMFSFVGESR